ncbi:GNAT family N-acetyltransferase [Paenibacillus sp. PK3_47]|uniref:GNAT family N-acetyltransferase n=1 Tax=Paenibacillus sp. PK3_47 TaxID=2072642 RepID=UPI00201DAFB3|nr:GNAT family N-acetyltransferase [Paenibacillus sp. PK3_47]UQZ32290.1 GNAT family N-acetyltransferase [Paenibacillus sp. PK3_47]
MLELESKDYSVALRLLRQVKINTLFAEAVLAGSISGKLYTDSVVNPRAFYVAHPYGMSLLYGNTDNETFIEELRAYIMNTNGARSGAEWLQADPASGWSGIIDGILADHKGDIRKDTRVNFSFNRDAYLAAKAHYPRFSGSIVRTSKEQFLTQAGTVVPRYFWRDAGHFAEKGVGFTLLQDGTDAATAFAAYITKHQLEIGIETFEGYRGRGYALLAASRLIGYCLDQGLEPVWACRLENQGSYRLAQKLGFEPVLTLPYYRLAE